MNVADGLEKSKARLQPGFRVSDRLGQAATDLLVRPSVVTGCATLRTRKG